MSATVQLLLVCLVAIICCHLGDSRPRARPRPRALARPRPRALARPRPRALARPRPRALARPRPRALARPRPRALPRPRAIARPRPRAITRPRALPRPRPIARPRALPRPGFRQAAPRPLAKPKVVVPRPRQLYTQPKTGVLWRPTSLRFPQFPPGVQLIHPRRGLYSSSSVNYPWTRPSALSAAAAASRANRKLNNND